MHTNKKVETAVKKSDTENEQKPRKKIEIYFDRIEKALDRHPEMTNKIIERFIIDDFVLDTDDEVLMTKLAKALYESEKRIAVERGRQIKYKNLNKMIINY
jgi:glycerol-3-phosphate cytidylyltransferase-like family protein